MNTSEHCRPLCPEVSRNARCTPLNRVDRKLRIARSRTRLPWLFLALLGMSVGLVEAQTPAPRLIPFQGRLTKQDGSSYSNGTYTLTFILYPQAVGGQPLWAETHRSVGLINGMLNVFLGSIQSFDAANNPSGPVSFAEVRHLGITIDADNNAVTPDPEMVPRQMIIPAFWAKSADRAVTASNADKLGSYEWKDLLMDNETNPRSGRIAAAKIGGRLQGSQIEQGAINAGHLAPASVTSGALAPGAVGSVALSADAVGTTQLKNESVTPLKLARRVAAANAPAGGIAVSTVASFSESVPGFKAVPDLRIQIVTTGRPVMVFLTAPGGPNEGTASISVERRNAAIEGHFRLRRSEVGGQGDASVIGDQAIKGNFGGTGGLNLIEIPASSVQFVDTTCPVGEHTYYLEVGGGFGDENPIKLNKVRLVAFEL